MTNLLFLLGDQLSHRLLASKQLVKNETVILMAEVHDETTYVGHHKKKLVFVLSSMRHFAAELEEQGWRVDYVTLEDPENTGSFTGELARALHRVRPSQILVTEPSEFRVLEMVRGWERAFRIPVRVLPDDRFLASHEMFQSWARGKRQLRMEFFYREMRRATNLLMDGEEPEGGRWNLDAQNRKPADPGLSMPAIPRFEPDGITREVIDVVRARYGAHFGDIEPFWFAVTAQDAERALSHFLEHALPRFGDFQDAMLKGEKFLYHSVTSLYLNIGFLDPLEMCRRAEAEYREGRAPLNAAEGFIRQIVGWREYVRGIYWLKMPGYSRENFFQCDRPLPEFYWTGETEMACVRACVGQTREEAYAHHIQRLMVTGNFALLAGIDPYEVHKWYLAVYADAYEWVELPNTLGMALFADGGLLGSKPYAASGNYINKMSDYCKSCTYDVKQRTGPKACPFNYLYWDFMMRNRETLQRNPRLGPVFRTLDAMPDARKSDMRQSARRFLDAIAAPSRDRT
jgi:deoxyribodipyrimidine photolyase-related protein